jgi:hypothetical protein
VRASRCATHVALCGLSPPDTAPASLLLSLLSPPSLFAASTTGYSRRLCGD